MRAFVVFGFRTDERRPTVNELANTAGIQQNANGAKVNRISDQFVQLVCTITSFLSFDLILLG